jgi:hypothetical protein
MDERTPAAALRFGVILIALGALFLLARAAPDLFGWSGASAWPLIIVGVGILLLLIGAATGAAGMAVPAAIVGGIGVLLFWQNATGNWQSWAYAWTLIPGFVGVGTLVAGLLEGNSQTVQGGLWLIVISLILFAIFSAIMAPFVGGPIFLGRYWPVLLILLGLLLLGRALFRPQPGDDGSGSRKP